MLNIFEMICDLIVVGLESLPKDLRKNFSQMRDLDTKSQGTYSAQLCHMLSSL